jgi:hypothetical protein
VNNLRRTTQDLTSVEMEILTLASLCLCQILKGTPIAVLSQDEHGVFITPLAMPARELADILLLTDIRGLARLMKELT